MKQVTKNKLNDLKQKVLATKRSVSAQDAEFLAFDKHHAAIDKRVKACIIILLAVAVWNQFMRLFITNAESSAAIFKISIAFFIAAILLLLFWVLYFAYRYISFITRGTRK